MISLAKLYFEHQILVEAVRFVLKEHRALFPDRIIPPDAWAEVTAPSIIPAIARIITLGEEHEDDPISPARFDGEGFLLSHPLVAMLDEYMANRLGLPPATRLLLGLDCRGNISQSDFDIQIAWLSGGTIPAIGARVRGSMLDHVGDLSRIPEPLFSIWHIVQAFRQTDTTDDITRFRLLAELMDKLPPEERHQLQTDSYLRRIRIVHATAFSLKLKTDANGFCFDPILFGRRAKDRWIESEAGAPVSEAENLLPETVQEVFARHRFPQWAECQDRYGLGDGYYVYMEPSVRQALSVVRRAQNADTETRRRFARNPQLFLKENLGDDLDESVIEQLFIPTEQYSERVLDLGVWQPVTLPWLKHAPTPWMPPEQFGLLIGGERITVKPEDVSILKSQVEEAIQRGEPAVVYEGVRIPASSETIEALGSLSGLALPDSHAEEAQAPYISRETTQQGQVFLTVDENFENLSFSRNCACRVTEIATSLPATLRTTLKQHQENGLTWLQSAWSRGLPGVLLADDMGLGKTLLSLTFLCWVRDSLRSKGKPIRPILVVAPTGLLKNWEAEHDRHLLSPGLGELLRAYGTELRLLRQADSPKNKDTVLGQPHLDGVLLGSADWVLTTYETLRDYHHSFARVKFSVAIYDEIQKLKNPASQLSRSAKTVNADFALGLTGTPIENRIEDLWAIMDIIYPGYLADLKSFSHSYREDDIESLRRLKARMMDEQGQLPAIMLRRMKADQLPGLPQKHEKPLREIMPEQQANAYADAVAKASGATGGSMLKTLHLLRSISLHPDPPNHWERRGDQYIQWSARLALTFRILDKIAKRGEKALIFLESLEMQEVLSHMLKQRYRLQHRPMLINGAVNGPKRQQAVDLFQDSRREFDAMILSPKAGGVGLTLTAANHVIHLSRWWNPAVEDQCTDRVFRIGQERDVHVYYPMSVHPSPDIADYSFDLKLHELLDRKRTISRDVLMPPERAEETRFLFESVVKHGLAGMQQPPAPTTDTTISLEEIDRMDPIEFEHWVIGRLTGQGFTILQTPRTGDGGADGILTNDTEGFAMIIQCKHRQKGNCSDSAVDDLLRARNAYVLPDARLMAVSNASFSHRAKERARHHGLVLIGRDKITRRPMVEL